MREHYAANQIDRRNEVDCTATVQTNRRLQEVGLPPPLATRNAGVYRRHMPPQTRRPISADDGTNTRLESPNQVPL